jgi:hypothetical protein
MSLEEVLKQHSEPVVIQFTLLVLVNTHGIEHLKLVAKVIKANCEPTRIAHTS